MTKPKRGGGAVNDMVEKKLRATHGSEYRSLETPPLGNIFITAGFSFDCMHPFFLVAF